MTVTERIITCADCGARVSLSKHASFVMRCRPCQERHRQNLARARYMAKKAAKAEARPARLICPDCGGEFDRMGRKERCTACAELRRVEMSRIYSMRSKQRAKASRAAQKKHKVIGLAEVAAMAQASGMSYGQYVAAQYCPAVG